MEVYGKIYCYTLVSTEEQATNTSLDSQRSMIEGTAKANQLPDDGITWLEDEGVNSDLVLVFTDGYLDDSDWEGLAREDILVALDRQPDSWIQRELDRNNINYIVAKAA